MALDEVFIEVKTNFEKKHPDAEQLTWYQFNSYLLTYHWQYNLTGVLGPIQHAMHMKISPNILLLRIWTEKSQLLTHTSMNFLQKN